MNKILEISDIHLEISDTDIDGRFTWNEAMDYASKLGDGWRLPTITELDHIYNQRESIGGFKSNSYWSSSECNANSAWDQNFIDGYNYNNSKNVVIRVRLVRNV